MKIFVSWSGPLSKSVAEKLSTWLRRVIQVLEPFVSSRDIKKGEIWLAELLKQLDESNIGIICVTRESLNSNWLLFESGALAKHVGRAKVCTLLIDVSPVELVPPLSGFQATTLKKDDVFRLMQTLHSSLPQPLLNDEELKVQFDACWDDLESHIKEALIAPRQTRTELQQLAEELLLPVIYREACEGELDTVFHWLKIAQKRNLADLEGSLAFVEASLARLTGKRGAGQSLRMQSQQPGDFQGCAFLELLILQFAAQTRLADISLDSSWINFLPEQIRLTALTLLGLWNIRERNERQAELYLHEILSKDITGDSHDYYRALPLGILCFALGQAEAGEKQFDLVKASFMAKHEGYPFISLMSEFDRAFVNVCIDRGSKQKLSDIRIREFRGHAWVLIQYSELMRRSQTALQTLIAISTNWKKPLKVQPTSDRLLQFQMKLVANSGTPILS